MEVIRSVLQPVTHSLPAPIRDIGVGLLGDACYQALVLDVDETNVDCIKLAVSKGLGVGIVGASAVVKVPQILNLVRSQSAEGVSFLSYLLETTSYLVSLAYNVRNGFPFSTYGETAFILVQNIGITLLVLHYSGKSTLAALLAGVIAVAATALFSETGSPVAITSETLGYLQAGAGALGVASKVPQIVAIVAQGGTGQLSAFTVFNYLAGSLSRIFTTLQEVDDKLILYSFIAGFGLNAVLATQMVYYWNAKKPAAAGKGGKGKSSKASKPAASKTAASKTASEKTAATKPAAKTLAPPGSSQSRSRSQSPSHSPSRSSTSTKSKGKKSTKKA